jgi:choline-sulfatase
MKSENKIVVGCMLLTSAHALANGDSAKPNILLIVTDQQSYNTISALRDAYPGIDTYSSTPNIDRLVNKGISFTNTYCANPVSVPSRFAMFTGLYGGKYNIRDNKHETSVQNEVVPVLNKYGMGQVFKAGGYQTYYAGKVHLPYATAKGSMFGHPVNYGFTEYVSDDDRDILGRDVANFIKNRTSTQPFLLVASFINPHDICLESSTNLSSTPVVDPKKPEIAATVNLARQAADVAGLSQYPQLPFNKSKTTGFPAAFTPRAFDDFPDDYWRRYRFIYSWMVNLVDSHIGDVLNALESSNLKNNTIIVFTSDHGEMQGAHNATVKNLPFEECMRVPLIISGPGIVQNQRDHSLLNNGTDLIPTLCELAGISSPSGLTGISVAQRSKGTGNVTQRQYLYTEGDDFSNVMDPTNGFKYTQFHISGTPEMLIDLTNDPGELVDISKKDVASMAVTSQLRDVLASAISNSGIKTSLDNTSLGTTLNYRKKNGTIEISGIREGSDVELYNLQGVKVKSIVTARPSEELKIPDLTSGIYIVRNEENTLKIIL